MGNVFPVGGNLVPCCLGGWVSVGTVTSTAQCHQEQRLCLLSQEWDIPRAFPQPALLWCFLCSNHTIFPVLAQQSYSCTHHFSWQEVSGISNWTASLASFSDTGLVFAVTVPLSHAAVATSSTPAGCSRCTLPNSVSHSHQNFVAARKRIRNEV